MPKEKRQNILSRLTEMKVPARFILSIWHQAREGSQATAAGVKVQNEPKDVNIQTDDPVSHQSVARLAPLPADGVQEVPVERQNG